MHARAGAKAFEWQQEIGLNQARRTGEMAQLENVFDWGMDIVAAAEASASQPDSSMQLAASTDAQVRHDPAQGLLRMRVARKHSPLSGELQMVGTMPTGSIKRGDMGVFPRAEWPPACRRTAAPRT